MSSSPPIRFSSGVGSAALLVLMVLLALVGAPAAAAEPPLVAVPAGTVDGQVRLVVQLPDGTGPLPPEAFTASVDGVAQPVGAEPVMSDRMAMALVVDASADAAPVLQAGLGGAANLLLAAPTSARSTLVTDGTPPTVAVQWPSVPADVLRGLSSVRPDGARSTAAALDLALDQLPTEEPGPRLVVLYTAAHDAGGEAAPEIVERMRTAGAVLAVVCADGGSTAGGDAPDFWSAVADGTGGVAVSATPPNAIAAFDRVTAGMENRYVVTLPEPDRVPTTAALRVDTGRGPLVGDVVLPAQSGGRGSVVAMAVGAAVAVVVLVVSAVALVRRRPRREGVEAAPVRRTSNILPAPDAPVRRQALLAELSAALERGRPVWLRPHPDVAGVGTTTTMAEFAHRYQDRYDVAWWIPALDPDLVPDRMAELAEALGLAGPADSADKATAALLEALAHRSRWLLVLDDAPGPRQLARYLPGGSGHVLVASSDSSWREVATDVPVPVFTRAESVSLLRSRRPQLSSESADRLAAALHDLPVALGPAAALLADPGTDVDTLLIHTQDTDPTEAVWTVALDRLAADDPLALALLTLAAWLGSAPVPLSLVVENPTQLPEPLAGAARTPSELAAHAETLRRRGLARVPGDDLVLHPVGAELLMARTRGEHADDGGWTAIAVRLLRAAVPDRPASEPADRAAWRRLLPHVLAATDPARQLDVVADDVGWLLGQAGAYLAARGRSKAAGALLEDAHEFDVGARLRAAGDR